MLEGPLISTFEASSHIIHRTDVTSSRRVNSTRQTPAMSHARPVHTVYYASRLLGHSFVTALGGGGASIADSRLHRHGLLQSVVIGRGTVNILFEHGVSLDDFKLGGHGVKELCGCIAAAARLARAVDVIHVFEFFTVTAPTGYE